ncbi:MAG: hydroxymethylpyrimidine/phosphomethylpyrimidine kinase [Candidatus Micrarchaeia archaeon]
MAVLSIGGFDPSCAAGICADIRTFTKLKVDYCTVLTSITAQNKNGVRGVKFLTPNFVKEQLQSVCEEKKINVVKIGMLGTVRIVHVVADFLKEKQIPSVLDPVMSAQAGGALMRGGCMEAIRKNLLPFVMVATPNLYETKRLTNIDVKSINDAKRASLILPCRTAVIKGIRAGARIYDVVRDGSNFKVFSKQYIPTSTRGGGCVFASAIASYLSQGYGPMRTVELAEKFISHAIRKSQGGVVYP